jgi:hypothetical protein
MWDLYLYLVVGAQTPPLDDEMSSDDPSLRQSDVRPL